LPVTERGAVVGTLSRADYVRFLDHGVVKNS
jgi:hypothetical protein